MKRVYLLLGVVVLLSGVALIAIYYEREGDGDGPTVEVQDAGAEPRRKLRLEPEEGQVERSRLTTEQNIEAAGQRLPVPPITTVFDSEVTSLDDDRIEISYDYGEAEVGPGGPPGTREQTQAGLAFLADIEGTAELERGGRVRESDVDIPEEAPDAFVDIAEQIDDQLGALAVPFPEEAVGIGATWTATSDLELSGIELTQTASYELTELDGDDYRVTVTIEQDYEPGEADGFEVIEGSGTTTGTITGSLTRTAPKRSEAQGTVRLRGEENGQEVDILTESKLSLTSKLVR